MHLYAVGVKFVPPGVWIIIPIIRIADNPAAHFQIIFAVIPLPTVILVRVWAIRLLFMGANAARPSWKMEDAPALRWRGLKWEKQQEVKSSLTCPFYLVTSQELVFGIYKITCSVFRRTGDNSSKRLIYLKTRPSHPRGCERSLDCGTCSNPGSTFITETNRTNFGSLLNSSDVRGTVIGGVPVPPHGVPWMVKIIH